MIAPGRFWPDNKISITCAQHFMKRPFQPIYTIPIDIVFISSRRSPCFGLRPLNRLEKSTPVSSKITIVAIQPCALCRIPTWLGRALTPPPPAVAAGCRGGEGGGRGGSVTCLPVRQLLPMTHVARAEGGAASASWRRPAEALS